MCGEVEKYEQMRGAANGSGRREMGELMGMYQSDEKIVCIGFGRRLRYEFESNKARMPALAAVSPKRETGPDSYISTSFVPIHGIWISYPE
jgi:hypothetical protein